MRKLIVISLAMAPSLVFAATVQYSADNNYQNWHKQQNSLSISIIKSELGIIPHKSVIVQTLPLLSPGAYSTTALLDPSINVNGHNYELQLVIGQTPTAASSGSGMYCSENLVIFNEGTTNLQMIPLPDEAGNIEGWKKGPCK